MPNSNLVEIPEELNETLKALTAEAIDNGSFISLCAALARLPQLLPGYRVSVGPDPYPRSLSFAICDRHGGVKLAGGINYAEHSNTWTINT